MFIYHYLISINKDGRQNWSMFLHLIINTIRIAFFSTLYLQKELHISRSFLAFFYILNVLLAILTRFIITKIVRTLREKGKNLKHVLLVGYSRAAESYIDRILGNPQWGYYIHGILDDNLEDNTSFRKLR